MHQSDSAGVEYRSLTVREEGRMHNDTYQLRYPRQGHAELPAIYTIPYHPTSPHPPSSRRAYLCLDPPPTSLLEPALHTRRRFCITLTPRLTHALGVDVLLPLRSMVVMSSVTGGAMSIRATPSSREIAREAAGGRRRAAGNLERQTAEIESSLFDHGI